MESKDLVGLTESIGVAKTGNFVLRLRARARSVKRSIFAVEMNVSVLLKVMLEVQTRGDRDVDGRKKLEMGEERPYLC